MNATIRKALPILSAALVSVIAPAYGVRPAWFARERPGIGAIDVAVAHVLRAVMGPYRAMAGFWLVAAFDRRLRGPALPGSVVFCGGLLAGRLPEDAGEAGMS